MPAPPSLPSTIKAEKLAYWFFRLNGCLTIENFVVHPDNRAPQRTDADIVGVRFPHRKELATSSRPMRDYPVFEEHDHKAMLFIAEIKLGMCQLNGPWTEPDRQNVQRVLNAVGAFYPHRVEYVARSLYDMQFYEDDQYVVRMFTLGKEENPDYSGNGQKVVQLTWKKVLEFIHERFRLYQGQKGNHQQWDLTGRCLWNAAHEPSSEAFVQSVCERLK